MIIKMIALYIYIYIFKLLTGILIFFFFLKY